MEQTTKDPLQSAVEAMAGIMLTFLKSSQAIQQTPAKSDEQIEGLPIVLQVRHVQSILGLSKSATYEIFKEPEFPSLEVNGRKIVYRESFFTWLNSKQAKVVQG